MPIDNYINPASLAPPLGWTPNGAYAGYQEGNRQADYEKQMGLSQLFQKLALEKQTAENQDFQAARPSALESTIATNQAKAQTAVPQAQANLASTQENTRAVELANKLKAGTIDSDMITRLAEGKARLGEIGQKQLDTSLNLAQSIAAIHEANPGSITPATIKAMAASLGVDENSPIVQTLMVDPGTSSKWASIIDKSNAAHRQKMEQIGLEKGADFDRVVTAARIEAQARLDAAGVTSGSTNLEAKAILDAYTKAEVELNEKRTGDAKLTSAQVGALVADRYSKSKWGVGGSRMEGVSDSSDREFAKKLAASITDKLGFASSLPEGQYKQGVLAGIEEMKKLRDSLSGSAPIPASGGAEIEQKLKAAGQSYEPDKYNYRIGPQGQVQKAPK